MDDESGNASKCTHCRTRISVENTACESLESRIRSKVIELGGTIGDRLLEQVVSLMKNAYDE